MQLVRRTLGGRVGIVIGVVLALSLAAGIGLGLGPQLGRDPEVVARVNGEAITKEELYQAMVRAVGQQTLQRLITERLVAQEAARAGVSVADAELDARVAELQADFGGAEAFQQVLAAYGMTLADVRQELRLNLLVERLVGEVSVSEEEVAAYYEANRDRYPDGIEAAREAIEAELQRNGFQTRAGQLMAKLQAQAEIQTYLPGAD